MSTTCCVGGNVVLGAPLPDPEGQIHESYAKTVQELKALAHQLWDQGDMLDKMRQWRDCSKQTSLDGIKLTS